MNRELYNEYRQLWNVFLPRFLCVQPNFYSAVHMLRFPAGLTSACIYVLLMLPKNGRGWGWEGLGCTNTIIWICYDIGTIVK